jgi:RsiW-degrading membrane proteinase PrsW (M82 family)
MIWFTLAFVFAGLWLYAFYREDKHEKEPIWMVALALGWGALSIYPALWLEGWLLPAGLSPEDSLRTRVIALMLIVGPVEELCKLAGVRFFLWPRTHFNEPMDGIVYAAAAATGFAFAENLHFMVDEPAVILARGPGGTLAHILFAGFWGSALGWSRFCDHPWQGHVMIALGLVWGSLTHGLFNLMTFSANQELSVWAARLGLLTLVVVSYSLVRYLMFKACAHSPFHPERRGTVNTKTQRHKDTK